MTGLAALVCGYDGPLRGRNRERVLNHASAVAARLRLVQRIRADPRASSALHAHHDDALSTAETVRVLSGCLGEDAAGPEALRAWLGRQHVELHVCDRCNLRCRGCTYLQDTARRPAQISLPEAAVARVCALVRPRAVTIVGGGEPALYRDAGQRLGDLICALGAGRFGVTPELGLITNGTLWPPGDPQWPRHVRWLRVSLDAANADSYRRSKGRDYFDRAIATVIRALTETSIPEVGVGFVYSPQNIAEAAPVISLFARTVRELPVDSLQRLNIQFRPWREPTGRPAIDAPVLSVTEAEHATRALLHLADADDAVHDFARDNTNIAVNLLCRGAREGAQPFSECFFGMAKTVVRADGSLYPCFRSAASEDPRFRYGDVLRDAPERLALRALHLGVEVAPQECVPDHRRCLFCMFNNVLEAHVGDPPQPVADVPGAYFF